MFKPLLLLAVPMLLWGQSSVYGPPRVQWTPKGRLVVPGHAAPSFLDPQKKPTRIHAPAPTKDVVALAAPGQQEVFEGSGVLWHEDALYLTTRVVLEGKWHLLLQRQGPKGWEVVARLRHPPFFNGASILPLENGTFLVLGNPWSPEPSTPERPWPAAAAIYRMGQDHTLTLSNPIPLKTPALLQNPILGNAFNKPLFTESSILVTSLEYGVVWVFSRKDGALRHEMRLFDDVTDAWITQRKSANITFGAQPLENGSVLVAGVPRKDVETHIKNLEEAVRREQSLIAELMRVHHERGRDKESSRDDQTLQDLVKEIWRTKARMNTLTPAVAWYRLDPDKGTFKDETEPVGAWSLLDKPKTLEHYLWLPEPDGSIRYYTFDLKAHADRPILPPDPSEAEEPASPKPKPAPARKAATPRKG